MATLSPPAELRPPPPPVDRSPILAKAAQAREVAAAKASTKQESKFQSRLGKRKDIVEAANLHLAHGQEAMQADLATEAKKVQQLHDKALATPSDATAAADYEAALKEFEANRTLVESVAAASIDKQDGRPTMIESNQKVVALTAVQADIVRRLNDPQLDDQSPEFKNLTDRLVGVSTTIRDLRDLVENRNPGVRFKAREAGRQFYLRVMGVGKINDTAGVDNYVQNIFDKSSLANDLRRTAYRYPSRGLDVVSPAIDRVMAQARAANEAHTGAVGELRDTVNNHLAQKRNEIYQQAADEESRRAASQKPAEKIASNIAVKNAYASEAEKQAAETQQQEWKKYVDGNGNRVLAEWQEKGGIVFSGMTEADILKQLIDKKLIDPAAAGYNADNIMKDIRAGLEMRGRQMVGEQNMVQADTLARQNNLTPQQKENFMQAVLDPNNKKSFADILKGILMIGAVAVSIPVQATATQP